MRKSWKTTLFGVLAAIGLGLTNPATAPKDPPKWLTTLAGVMALVGAAGTGAMARDNDKSSEDQGIK